MSTSYLANYDDDATHDLRAELTAAYAWIKEHSIDIKRQSDSGDPDAHNLIVAYQMMVRHADIPTAGVLLGALDCYKRSIRA